MKPQPIGGPVMTRGITALLAVFAVAAVLMIWRFIAGLGATTNLNDGFPWGIWIAFDVVVGTALACGGYAVAILCYIMNRGRYHPLVRPAVLTSALGYSLAGLAIVVDVGRYWLLPQVVASPQWWNLNSVLLEVALCVMAYVVVLWIEFSPAVLESGASSRHPRFRRFSRRVAPMLDRALIWILALGLVLPTMHQSSLGSVMLIAMDKLSPLWHSPWLPLLFLTSCIAMGYAVVVVESTLSGIAFKRPRETSMLATLGSAIALVLIVFLGLRVFDLAARGALALTITSGWLSVFFLLESAMFVTAVVLLLRRRVRYDEGKLLMTAVLMLGGGALYRFNTYLIGFNPGPGWTYFPSVPEILVTVGIVAFEVAAYVFLVKRLPILGGVESTIGSEA